MYHLFILLIGKNAIIKAIIFFQAIIFISCRIEVDYYPDVQIYSEFTTGTTISDFHFIIKYSIKGSHEISHDLVVEDFLVNWDFNGDDRFENENCLPSQEQIYRYNSMGNYSVKAELFDKYRIKKILSLDINVLDSTKVYIPEIGRIVGDTYTIVRVDTCADGLKSLEITLHNYSLGKYKPTVQMYCNFLNIVFLDYNDNFNEYIWSGAYWSPESQICKDPVRWYFYPRTGYENYPVLIPYYQSISIFCHFIGGRLST